MLLTTTLADAPITVAFPPRFAPSERAQMSGSTFTLKGAPVGKAAINAVVELKIAPASNGYGIAIQLGKPVIHANVLDDIPNQTTLTDADLAKAVELCLDSQIASVSALLGSIPLPTMPAGLTMKDMSVSSDDGYVMMKGTLE